MPQKTLINQTIYPAQFTLTVRDPQGCPSTVVSPWIQPNNAPGTTCTYGNDNSPYLDGISVDYAGEYEGICTLNLSQNSLSGAVDNALNTNSVFTIAVVDITSSTLQLTINFSNPSA